MSQLVNTKYMRKLNEGNFKPVYLVIFDGIGTRFSSGPVTQALGPTLPYVANLSGGAAQVTVDQGRSSLASTTIEILDIKGFITKLAFQYQLGNRMVTIKAGFQGMPETSFINVYVGRVNNYTLQANNVTWTFELVSMMTDTFPTIFDLTATLDGAITDVDTVVTVDSTISWPAATGGVCYILVDQEVISYTGATTTTFTGCVRGLFGTTAVAHSDGATISNFFVLEGNPLTLALQILTSTGAGTNGPYDVLPANAGLAIDVSLINVARFEQMRDRWLTTFKFRFEEFRPVTAKQFLEEQVYTFCNSYPTIDNNGLLSVNVYAPPLPSQINANLDDKQMVSPPTFSGNVFSDYFFNHIDFSYDYDFLADLNNTAKNNSTGPYDTRVFYDDPASQAVFNQAATKIWQSRGIRSAFVFQLMTAAQIKNIATRFLKRFSIPSPKLKVRVFYETRLLEQADIFPLTSKKIPNLSNGKLGVDHQLMEIISIQPDYLNGIQTLEVINTGYSYGRKYGAISPTTQPPINFPNFSAATPAEKNYCFISKKINATKGVMGDGSDGYYITP